MTPHEVLAVPMQPNDADAATIGDYLTRLLLTLWEQGEGFSGKRPFGNSGWNWEVYAALAKAGAIEATFDDDGYLDTFDDARGNALIRAAITAMVTT